MRPGWQTTEFWLTLAMTAITVLAVTGHISPEDKPKVEVLTTELVTKLGAVLANAGLIYGYIHNRTQIKRWGPSE